MDILEELFLGKLHPFEDKGVLTDEGYREAMEPRAADTEI